MFHDESTRRPFPEGGEAAVFRSLWRRTNRAVLIVSEDPSGPLLHNDFLRQSELGLLTAFPGTEALDIARRRRPGLIIEDLDPPGHTGLAFCSDLASDTATRSIPLILVAPETLRRRARATHAEVVLDKPLDGREFFCAVRRFVTLPRRRRQRANVNLRFTYGVGDQMGQAFSRDLSSRGAFLKTDRIFLLGTRLDLSVCIPGVADQLKFSAVVRGTSSMLHSGESGGVGVEFVDLPEADRKTLERFIDQLNERRGTFSFSS
jgi:CheY-like chemotaxis protein